MKTEKKNWKKNYYFLFNHNENFNLEKFIDSDKFFVFKKKMENKFGIHDISIRLIDGVKLLDLFLCEIDTIEKSDLVFKEWRNFFKSLFEVSEAVELRKNSDFYIEDVIKKIELLEEKKLFDKQIKSQNLSKNKVNKI